MMKKLTALLLSFMMILSNFVPVITFAQENSGRDDNYEYIGYQDGSTGTTNKLYVEKRVTQVVDELFIALIRPFTGLTRKVLQIT